MRSEVLNEDPALVECSGLACVIALLLNFCKDLWSEAVMEAALAASLAAPGRHRAPAAGGNRPDRGGEAPPRHRPSFGSILAGKALQNRR